MLRVFGIPENDCRLTARELKEFEIEALFRAHEERKKTRVLRSRLENSFFSDVVLIHLSPGLSLWSNWRLALEEGMLLRRTVTVQSASTTWFRMRASPSVQAATTPSTINACPSGWPSVPGRARQSSVPFVVALGLLWPVPVDPTSTSLLRLTRLPQSSDPYPSRPQYPPPLSPPLDILPYLGPATLCI